MTIPLIDKEDVLIKSFIKETKERIKDQKYKTYSVQHDLENNKKNNGGLDLNKFFWDYNEVLNSIIKDIWDTILWKEWEIKIENEKNYYRYTQKRLYPNYRNDSLFKTDIRDEYLLNWKYSAHWIDSVISTAFSILDSWKKNYNKGKRRRNCPVAKRLFVRVKQTMMKIEGDKLRISIKPRQFIYVDLSKRYFKMRSTIF